LWEDEWVTLRVSRLPLDQLISSRLGFWDSPVYFLGMHFWVAWFGSGEAALRFPSALFGTASVSAVYLLTRELFHARAAILSSWLVGISASQVWFSQEARMYSAAIFFALAATFSLVRALRTGRRPWWVGYAFFTLLAILMSASLIFVTWAQAVYVLWHRRNDPPVVRAFGLCAAFWVLLYSPLLLLAVWMHLEERLFGAWTPLSPWTASQIRHLLFNLFSIGPVGMLAPKELGQIVSWGVWGFLAGLSLVSLRFLMRGPQREGAIFLLLLFIFPITGLLASSGLFNPWFRYVLFSSVPPCVLIAAYLADQKGLKRMLLLGLVSAVSLVSLGSYFRNTVKPPWRLAARYVQERSDPRQAVLTHRAEVFRYYYRDAAAVKTLHAPIFPTVADQDRFWLVMGPSAKPRSGFGQDLLRWLDSSCDRRESRLFKGIQVIYYVRKAGA